MAERSGVVLSGGGATGAYEVGILKALVSGESPGTNYRPLQPAVFAATSIGAFNASVLLSHFEGSWPVALEVLEGAWSFLVAGSTSHNGVFRLRANPLQLFDVLSRPASWTAAAVDFADDVMFLARDGFTRVLEFLATPIELEARIAEFFDIASWVSHDPSYK